MGDTYLWPRLVLKIAEGKRLLVGVKLESKRYMIEKEENPQRSIATSSQRQVSTQMIYINRLLFGA